MEHRLITGGAQFLPFARNCVKRLKSTGLSYASQTFVIDGVNINVRIADGHEFIRIDGGGVTMQMDSGVVDLGNMGYETTSKYLAGKLFATSYYSQYTTGFVKPVGKWLTKPGTTSAGQFAGRLTSFKGAIKPDGEDAASFSPNTIELPTVPVTTGPNPADDTLLAKKLLAQLCPASMFTGKCRLWIQAVYGSPTRSGNNGHVRIGSTTGRPWLRFDSIRTDEQGDYTEVGVTTNSGVFLDPLTGNHWLLDASDQSGSAMPLVSSGAGETLRKTLKDHLTGKKILNAKDAEHLEAFILSEARPDPTRVQYFSFTPTKSVWSLGYGWHWNWSGTKANFVSTELFYQDDGTGATAMRSTHYRLDVSFASGVFSATSTVVRGPDDWTLVPSQWCIVEPDWSSNTASKLQPSKTKMMAGSADFYAYYNRDTLVTCSVNVEEHSDSEDNFVDMSDQWTGTGSTPLGPQYAYTVGMRDGHYTARTAGYGKYHVATFDTGGGMSGPCYFSRSWQEVKYSISNKAMTTYPTAILWDYGYIPYPQNIPYGYPPYEYASLFGVPDIAFPPTVEYDYKSHTKNVSFYSYAHIIVPFYDAEAIASHIESHQYALYPASNSGRYATQGLQVLHRPKIFEGTQMVARGEYLQQVGYAMQQGNQSPTVITPVGPAPQPDTDDILVSTSKLSAAGTTLDAVIPDRYDYAEIAKTNVDIYYTVVSGVQESSDAVVISKSVDVKYGIDHDCTNPVVVGWV